MNVYSIDVPQFDNAGLRYSYAARQSFLASVLDHAGGFSSHDASGVWRNPDDGAISVDALTVVQFAIAPEYESEGIGAIKLQFSRSFPDQKALYIAQIGTAEVITL